MNFGPVVLVSFIAYLLVSNQGGKLWSYATTPAPGWPGLFESFKADFESAITDVMPGKTTPKQVSDVVQNTTQAIKDVPDMVPILNWIP